MASATPVLCTNKQSQPPSNEKRRIESARMGSSENSTAGRLLCLEKGREEAVVAARSNESRAATEHSHKQAQRKTWCFGAMVCTVRGYQRQPRLYGWEDSPIHRQCMDVVEDKVRSISQQNGTRTRCRRWIAFSVGTFFTRRPDGPFQWRTRRCIDQLGSVSHRVCYSRV